MNFHFSYFQSAAGGGGEGDAGGGCKTDREKARKREILETDVDICVAT